MSTAAPTAFSPSLNAPEQGRRDEALTLSPRPSIVISPVRPEDLPAFKDIEQLQKKVRGCSDLETIPSFTLQNLAEGCGQVMIARDGGKTVGYAFAFLRQDPETGDLSFYSVPVGVDPEYRGKGISQQLIDALHQDAANRKIVRSDWRPDTAIDLPRGRSISPEGEISVSVVNPGDNRTLKEVEDLQRKIWGYSDIDIIPAAILRDLASGCGQLLVARCGENPVGFAFTFLSRNAASGVNSFYLDLVGVDAEHQDRGIGTKLMYALRDDALARGVSRIEWRYDGLETRNARLYLEKLKAQVIAFKENSYGIHDDIQSDGLPTDRFVVRWDLNRDAVSLPSHEGPVARALTVNADGGPVLEQLAHAPSGERISMAVPLHFQALKDRSRTTGNEWISAFRRASNSLFKAGYQIVGFRAEREGQYGEYLWANSDVTRS